jgi:pSer/pThr/pTyr-binding forkhead associated (FHA) protein
MSTGSSHMRLEVISGNAAGTSIAVEDELVIGRHAEGAGRLSEDEEISRQHARISREATGDYAIEDLGSSNGTFVNGLRIQSPRLLSLGDLVETGGTTLVVREVVRPGAGSTVVAAVPDVPPAGGYAPTVFARSPPAPVAPPGPEATPVPPPALLPAPEATPVPPPTPAPHAAPAPPLKLALEIDFEARRAQLALGDDGDTVDLSYEDGRWRARPAEPGPAGS